MVGDEEQRAFDVASLAVRAAGSAFGPRLRCGAVIGSLAHGGFSSLASDVDVALVLADAGEDDSATVAAVSSSVRAGGAEFADRLSVFWGTVEQMQGDAPGGRFPPADRLDFIDSGRVLVGEDVRASLRRPSVDELVVAGAEFTVTVLADGDRVADIADPLSLVAKGPRLASKLVLFPVRFLYTAATGRLGRNDDAVAWYAAGDSGRPGVALVQAAYRWRTSWTEADRDAARRLLADLGLVYDEFVADYVARLRAVGRDDLVGRLDAFRA